MIFGFPMHSDMPITKQLPIKMGIWTLIMVAIIVRDGFDVTKKIALNAANILKETVSD